MCDARSFSDYPLKDLFRALYQPPTSTNLAGTPRIALAVYYATLLFSRAFTSRVGGAAQHCPPGSVAIRAGINYA